jgi:hypothetical protein
MNVKLSRNSSRNSLGLRAAILLAGAFLLAAPRAHANYRAKAIEATDYIQRAFYDEQAKIYHSTAPLDPKALPYAVMWDNGVQFSVLAAATNYEPERYKKVLYDFSKGLERYWDKDAAVPGFDAYFASRDNDDKYYDDNAWLVLGFMEANRVTRDPFFADWARKTHNFVLSGEDDKLGGGIYWYQNKKESKNTCITAPAIVSAIALYEAGSKQFDLETAHRLYKWTCAHLQDKDGLMWDNIKLDGKIEYFKWTYNSALMIRANLGLWRVTRDAKYLAEARRMSDASLAKWVEPQSGAFGDGARFNHLLAEALLETYGATQDLKYLNAVRRHADFGYRYVRDVRDGGYFNDWSAENRNPGESKTMIENASVARLYWLLVPYDDVEELRAKGDNAFQKGDGKAAIRWYRQAFDSTAGAAPTKAPPAKTAKRQTELEAISSASAPSETPGPLLLLMASSIVIFVFFLLWKFALAQRRSTPFVPLKIVQ